MVASIILYSRTWRQIDGCQQGQKYNPRYDLQTTTWTLVWIMNFRGVLVRPAWPLFIRQVRRIFFDWFLSGRSPECRRLLQWFQKWVVSQLIHRMDASVTWRILIKGRKWRGSLNAVFIILLWKERKLFVRILSEILKWWFQVTIPLTDVLCSRFDQEYHDLPLLRFFIDYL